MTDQQTRNWRRKGYDKGYGMGLIRSKHWPHYPTECQTQKDRSEYEIGFRDGYRTGEEEIHG